MDSHSDTGLCFCSKTKSILLRRPQAAATVAAIGALLYDAFKFQEKVNQTFVHFTPTFYLRFSDFLNSIYSAYSPIFLIFSKNGGS